MAHALDVVVVDPDLLNSLITPPYVEVLPARREYAPVVVEVQSQDRVVLLHSPMQHLP